MQSWVRGWSTLRQFAHHIFSFLLTKYLEGKFLGFFLRLSMKISQSSCLILFSLLLLTKSCVTQADLFWAPCHQAQLRISLLANSVRCSLCSLPSSRCCLNLHFNYFLGALVISHSGFNLHSHCDNYTEPILIYVIPSVSFPIKCVRMLQFYGLIFTIGLYILDTGFCVMHVLQYFSQSVFDPLVFLLVSFNDQNFRILLKTIILVSFRCCHKTL